MPVVAACFLSFVGGAIVADFRLFPYRLMFKRPFAYARAYAERRAEVAEIEADGPPPAAGRVTVPAGPGAFDGYTFLTFDRRRPSTARLIDMQGRVVHEWHRPFAAIWPDHPQRADAPDERAVAWRYAQLFPGGDIITTVKAHAESPEGCGLVKLDKDSNVIWAVGQHFHHQFSVAADGRIYALAHDWRRVSDRPVAGAPFLPDPVLEDFVVELSPDGKELSRLSLLDAMAAPGARELLGSAASAGFHANAWDPLHPNDVEVIGADFASHHEFLKPGMVLVSFRDVDALVVLDPKTGGVAWTMRGPWLRQHDPDLLGNGNVLLFDNEGNKAGGGSSRLLEIEPSTGRVVWSYTGLPQQPFESELAGGQQRLPNGNTLAAEDYGGRLVEVTPDGRTVWEYRDVRLHHATRVPKDWIQFVPTAPAAAADR